MPGNHNVNINYKIRGLEKVTRTLDKLPTAMERRIGLRALRKGGRIVINAARQKLRANGSDRTGTLRKSLAQKAIKSVTGRLGLYIGPTTGKGAKYDGWYAHLVEFGTGPKVVSSNKVMSDGSAVYGKEVEHPGSAPKPFLRPAIDETKQEVFKVVGESLYIETIKELNK